MRQLITLILVFISTTLILISGEWKTVYYEGTLIQWDLGCADSMNCISLGAPGGTGTRIIKTTDGGYNWKIIYNNVAEKIYNDEGQWVTSIPPDFNAPRSLAYVTQDLVVVGREDGQITISKDGGYTWEGVQLNSTKDISYIKFIGENYGIAFGEYGKSVFKTNDSGKNWEDVNLDYFGDGYGTSNVSIDLVGKDSMVVLIYNFRDQEHKFYTICRTIDGGETWDIGSKIPRYAPYKLCFISMEEGWLVGRIGAGNDKYYDVIFYTSDGGHTWDSQLDTLVYPELGLSDGVYFADKNEGLAYGDGGKIWRTSDKGANWYLDNSYPFIQGGADHFTKLTFPNNNTSKIIANVYMLGRIWLYEDLTSVEDNTNLENLFIYPNPAGDFINISIDNDADLLAREVQILDLLGLVVSKQELTDGNNRIDISNLPRGTYFIKVGDRVEKFVKM